MKNNLIIKVKGDEISINGDIEVSGVLALISCLLEDVIENQSAMKEISFEEELDNTLDIIKETILESKEELEELEEGE